MGRENMRGVMRFVVGIVGIVAAMVGGERGAMAQCDRYWAAAPNGIADGGVTAMVSWDPDGAGSQAPLLVVAGGFSAAADVAVSNIAGWDGTGWRTFGAGLNGQVYALAVFNGELYAGGGFTASGATPLHYLAKWTGSAWQDVLMGTDGAVYALAVNGSELLVGGQFTHVAGTFFPFPYLARYSAAGGWSAYAGLPTGTVSSMAVFAGQPLVMMKDSSTNAVFYRLAQYDGAAWQTKASTSNPGPIVVFGSDAFVSTQDRNNSCFGYSSLIPKMLRYNGTTVTTLPDLVYASSFATLNGVLYGLGVHRQFCENTTTISWLGQWDGSTWHDVVPQGSVPNGSVIAPYNGSLYMGGTFVQMGLLGINRVARWTGTAWEPLVPGFNAVARCAASVGGAAYVGGDFTHAGSNAAGYVSTYTGSAWVGLGNLDALVTSIAGYASNPLQAAEVVMSGQFTHSGGTAVGHMVRWNPITHVYTAFGTGLDASAWAMMPVSTASNHADLVVGGDFVNAGGVSAPHIARWNGGAWITAPFGTGMNGSVLALANFGSQIVAGGSFTTAGGAARAYIARWDGAAWQPLGTGMNGAVRALAVVNGQLVAGGDFTAAGGLAASHVAAWDGTTWTAMGPGVDGVVYGLAAIGTDLFVGGQFLHAGAVPVNNVAKWSGGAWGAVGLGNVVGNGVDDAILGLANVGGDLIAAGGFSHADGQFSHFVARAAAIPQAAVVQDPASVTVCPGGLASFHVTLDPWAFTLPPHFAWYWNGLLLTDETSAHGTIYSQTSTDTLQLANIAAADAGGYWCVMTTDCSQATTSATAGLTVGGATCCRADFNGDGLVTVSDIFAFLSAWFTHNPSADFDGVNGITVSDIFAFLSAWFAGCH